MIVRCQRHRQQQSSWRTPSDGSRHPTGVVVSAFLLLLLSLVACAAADPPNPVAPVGCSAAQGTCIRIGYFACRNPATCADVVGYNEMIAWYRQRTTTIQGVPVYYVEATQAGFFTSTPPEVNATIARVFIGPTPGVPLIDYAILPFGSVWDTGMFLLEQAKIPSVSGLSPSGLLYQCGATEAIIRGQLGCTQTNSRRYQYAHGPSNPGEQYLQPWVGQMKLNRARTIGVVRTLPAFYSAIRNGLVLTASDNHMRLVFDRVVPDNLQATVTATLDDLMALTDDNQPDGLALITQDCVPWIQAMKAANYAPKSVAAILCSDGIIPITKLGVDLNYIVGSSQWAPGLSGNDYTENADTQPWALFPHIRGGQAINETSPLQFQRFFQQLLGKPNSIPGYSESGVLVAPSMLEAAFSLAQSVQPEQVNGQLEMIYQSSYYGLLTANRFGQNNQKQLVINQRSASGVLEIISPPSSATADLIYPMPRWDERAYTPKMFATSIERILIALILVCCLFTLGLMAYIFHHRRQQIFQAAGVKLYMVMGLGCLVAFVSILTWPVENNAATCDARIWLWTCSFLMVVTPILASSYRIARIFSNKLHAVKITNLMVGLICLGLAAPQLLINCLWAGLAPLSSEVVTSDPLRPAFTSFTTCSLGDDRLAFVGLTLAYCCLLLVSAVFLATRIRNASSMFNDAQPIAASIFLFALVAAIVLVVQISFDSKSVFEQKVLFGLRSIGVLLAYQGSIGMLFLRRILDSRQQFNSKNAHNKLNGVASPVAAAAAAAAGVAPIQMKQVGGGGTPPAAAGGGVVGTDGKPTVQSSGTTSRRKETVTPGAVVAGGGGVGARGDGAGDCDVKDFVLSHSDMEVYHHQHELGRSSAVLPSPESYNPYVLSLVPQCNPSPIYAVRSLRSPPTLDPAGLPADTPADEDPADGFPTHAQVFARRPRSVVHRISMGADPLPSDRDLQAWSQADFFHLVKAFYAVIQDQKRTISSGALPSTVPEGQPVTPMLAHESPSETPSPPEEAAEADTAAGADEKEQ